MPSTTARRMLAGRRLSFENLEDRRVLAASVFEDAIRDTGTDPRYAGHALPSASPVSDGQQTPALGSTLEADLATVSLTLVGSNQIDTGQSFAVDYSYQNMGGTPVEIDIYDVGFYLSTDPVITAEDSFLAFFDGPAIAAGETVQGSFSLAINNGNINDSGTYFLGMIVDDLFQFVEPDEANNFSSQLGVDIVTLEITAIEPDLPRTLFNNEGFAWDIQTDGSISNGTNDAYDGGHDLLNFVGSTSAEFEDNDREVVIGPEQQGAVTVARKIFVPENAPYVRFLEIITNTSDSIASHTVQIDTNLGSDSDTEFVLTGTGFGDPTNSGFSVADDWIVTDDAEDSGDPVVAHVISGAGGINPSSVNTTAPGDDDITYTYDLTLDPGETQIVMHFGLQSSNRGLATFFAQRLRDLEFDLTSGMSVEEIAQVVNFFDDFAPDFPFEAPQEFFLNQFGDLTLTKSLGSPRPVDTLELVADASGPITITTSGSLDTQLAYYDGSTGPPDIIDDNSGAGLNASISTNISTGSFGVAATGDGVSSGSYTLTIDAPAPFVSDVPIFELNNKGDFSGSISSSDNDPGDWFAFTALQEGEWQVDFDGSFGVSADLTAFTAEGEVIDGPTSSPFLFLQQGEQVFMVVHGTENTNSGSYDIEISGPDPFPEFPFDAPIELIPNQFGDARVSTTLDFNPDTDDYVVAVEASGSVSLSSFNELSALAYYTGSSEPDDIDDDNGSGANPQINSFFNGDGAFGLSVAGLGGYTLDIDAADESPLLFNFDPTFNRGDRPGSIDAEFDVDWFQFFPDRPGDWIITITPDFDLDPELALFDTNGLSLHDTVSGDEHLPINLAEGGGSETFTLTVGDSDLFESFAFRVGGNAGSTGGYQVTVQGPVLPDSYNSETGSTSVITADVDGFVRNINGFDTGSGTDFYFVRTDRPGQVSIDVSGDGEVALAYYDTFDSPPVEVVLDANSQKLTFDVQSFGEIVIVGVRSNDFYTLSGQLPEANPNGLFIHEFSGLTPFNDGTEFVSLENSFDVEWLAFEVPVGGDWDFSLNNSDINFTVFNDDLEILASQSGGSTFINFEEGDRGVVRFEFASAFGSFDSFSFDVLGPQNVGGSVILDMLTAPFIIQDRFASNISFDLDWVSLDGAADSFEVLLLRQLPDGTLDQATFVSEFFTADLAFDSTPGTYMTDAGEVASAVDFYEAEDSSVEDGETVYRVRLRAFDGDGLPSIQAIEIDNFTVTAATTFVQGDYNEDGVTDAADYTVWRDAAEAGYSTRIDGDGDGTIDRDDYQIWRNNYGAVATANAPAPGDYNGDGVTDAADYTVWRDALGSVYNARVDGDGDGSYGAGDYLLWRASYGDVSRPATWDFEDPTSLPAGWFIEDDAGQVPGLLYGDWEIGASQQGVGSGRVLRMFHFTPAEAAAGSVLATQAWVPLESEEREREPARVSPAPQVAARSLDLLLEVDYAADYPDAGDTELAEFALFTDIDWIEVVPTLDEAFALSDDSSLRRL